MEGFLPIANHGKTYTLSMYVTISINFSVGFVVDMYNLKFLFTVVSELN